MSLTRNDIETLRDIAKASILLSTHWRMHYPVGHEAVPFDDARPFFQAELAEIRCIRERLSALAFEVTDEVLHLVRITNSYSGPRPCFNNREYASFHELALAIPNQLAEALTGLMNAIATKDEAPMTSWDLFGFALRTCQPKEGDLRADEVAAHIETEAAAAIWYLDQQRSDSCSKLDASGNSVLDATTSVTTERDPDMEARDQWIYKRWCDGMRWSQIREELATQPLKNRIFGSLGGIRRAAYRYAERHGLPVPAKRQSGRPRTS